MTVKQRIVAKKILDDPRKPIGQIMEEAGYAKNTAIAPTKNLLSSDGFQEIRARYTQKLIEMGLDETKMAQKLAEWLDAVKVSNSLTEPDRLVPDYQTQLKAGDIIREDLKLKPEKNAVQVLNQGEMSIEFTS